MNEKADTLNKDNNFKLKKRINIRTKNMDYVIFSLNNFYYKFKFNFVVLFC